MATRSDGNEFAVDELRRRARRRLVGAIVLALAAAVLLPLLLESEPKSLGDDVSIQIPPVDSGKFINPLSSAKTPDPKAKGNATAGRNAPQAPGPAGASDASPAVKEGAGVPPPSAPALGAALPLESDKQAAAGKAAPPEGKAVAAGPSAGTPAVEPTLQAKAAAAATAPESASPGAAYVVQIAAFSDHFGARSLASKLKQGGFPGYTEAVTTEKGTLHRVRVGPYASREAADAALVKLKAAGFNGMVARAG